MINTAILAKPTAEARQCLEEALHHSALEGLKLATETLLAIRRERETHGFDRPHARSIETAAIRTARLALAQLENTR